MLIFAWFVSVGTFAVTSALVHFLIPGGSLFGAPPWAWGLAAVIGVIGCASAPAGKW